MVPDAQDDHVSILLFCTHSPWQRAQSRSGDGRRHAPGARVTRGEQLEAGRGCHTATSAPADACVSLTFKP